MSDTSGRPGEDQRLEPQLAMRRDDLQDLPAVRLPRGYHLRTFLPGDEASWDRIIGESFQKTDADGFFNQKMRPDAVFSEDRVHFICHGQTPVATASAWDRPAYGRDCGYLHYVGVLPSQTGQGLGLQVSLACLQDCLRRGRAAAALQTDDFRIPAIKTYLKLGFAPLIVHDNQRRRWTEIFHAIGRPELIGRFQPRLRAPIFRLSTA